MRDDVNIEGWLASLERRHLANLTRPELTRALRALSSCYVERRDKLTEGAALEGAGKRAAFALFYGPLHFLTIGKVVRSLEADRQPIERITDLGCGTGVAGAAWARACAQAPSLDGIDRNRWAAEEANWTWRELGLHGRARLGDVVRNYPGGGTPRSAVLLAYAVNELAADTRRALLPKVEAGMRAGVPVLIVEAIALRDKTWWPEWSARLGAAGARADEWRFTAALPPIVRDLARGAGLDPRELTARTLYRTAAA
jgi:methyltransferase family protein